jgi:hypothetical protein
MFRSLRLLIAIIAIAFCLPLSAQEVAGANDSQSSAKVTSRADLVLVPVIVNDKSGRHVAGLG